MKYPGSIIQLTAWFITLALTVAFVDVGLWPLIPCLPLAYIMLRSWWRERGVRVTDDEIAEFLRATRG